MENVRVNVTDNKPCEVSLAVEIDQSIVNKERESVFENILKEAKMPGFRRGKAPMGVIKQAYMPQAKRQVMENLISRVIPEVLREKNINPVDSPRIEKFDFDFDKVFTIHVKVETQPDVKVKDYKKIKIKKKQITISDEQVSTEIDQLRDRNARLVVVPEGKVSREHFVIIDYAGRCEGKVIPGMQAKNQMLDLGAPQMMQGLAEGIVGLSAGEEKSIEVDLPAQFPNKEFAGKKASFAVTIREIKTKVLPAADDDFAKDLGVTTLEELKKNIRANLESQAVRKTDQSLRDQIAESVLQANVFQVPASLVVERKNYLVERTKKYFLSQGYSAQEWEKQKEALTQKVDFEAEKQVRLSYILVMIGSAEKIDVSDTDFQADCDKAVAGAATQEQEIRKYYQEHKNNILSKIKEDKIFSFLLERAKIKIEK